MLLPNRCLLSACIGAMGLGVVLSAGSVWAHSSAGAPPDQRSSRGVPPPPDPGPFVNFETPHVHPIDISPDGATLAVCNTPDGRVEIYDINQSNGQLTHLDTIQVGYDPVTARFRTNTELWVVNQISDSVSVVDVAAGIVRATLFTDDEPADVVFYTDSGDATPLAAVSCSRPDKIQIFNTTTRALVEELPIKSEDPRALVTDGTNVYVAPFASGNSTTILSRSAVNNGGGPYGGQNPPFNNVLDVGFPGDAWVTPLGSVDFGTIFQTPPRVGLIVRKDGGGAWRDDNGTDWTNWVSGASAGTSGRVVGWDVTDNDIASFSTNNGVTSLNAGFGTGGWVTRRMTTGMALAQNPGDGSVMLVGTEATNEIRFEPVIEGTFARVMVAIADGSNGSEIALVDMNEQHLAAAQGGPAYVDGSVNQTERDKSIGDPRGIAFNPAGTRAYVTGMGSGNVVVINPATGARLGGVGYTIDLGSPTPGPTGIVHHASLNRAYVVNRFASSVMMIDTTTLGSEAVVQTLPFFDPTPQFINDGRDDFYDTHQNSGLGQISCASCHIDGRTDQLAWDLGNPLGGLKPTNQVNPAGPGAGEHNILYKFFLDNFGNPTDDFHDMKGPMTTQTLVDIIGKEPHHWRGDRDGIEEFAAAFQGLQGDDSPLLSGPMQQFENFLGSLHFGPNPFRALDNSLPGGPKLFGGGNNPDLPLDGYFSNGPNGNNPALSARGTALPAGDAFRGFQLYVRGNPLHSSPTPGHDTLESLDNVFQCVSCHALPTGKGPITAPVFNLGQFEFEFVEVAPGPNGERHTGLFTNDGTGDTDGVNNDNQGSFTVAQLRNQLDKHGFNMKLANASTLGFGVLHDGSVDDLDSFLGSNAFDLDNDQDLADLIAFTLCINGDGFNDLATLPGAPTFESNDLPIDMATVGQLGPDGGTVNTAHAAVGQQVTIDSNPPSPQQASRINLFLALATNNRVDLIVKGVSEGNRRGWYLKNGSYFQSDKNYVSTTVPGLLALADVGTELTFTVVPKGLGPRMGVDRDGDGSFDFTEFLNGTDPADSSDFILATPAATPWGLIALAFGLSTAGIVFGIRRAYARRRV